MRMSKIRFSFRSLLAVALVVSQLQWTVLADTITGTVRGRVVDQSNAGLPGVRIKFINQETGNQRAVQTSGDGTYQLTLLPLGRYTLDIAKAGYVVTRPTQEPIRLQLNQTIETVPDIIMTASTIATGPTPTPTQPTTPVPTPTTPAAPAATTPPLVQAAGSGEDAAGRLTNRNDATRRFNADDRMVNLLPLGGVRTFDDLAFLSPGVMPPPEVRGVTGPGIGSGIGTAGQFSVNGNRARSNNFTVDGSDNNDEDVGVRRQGFVSLVPQSIESIQEFQIVTHLWDAESGRSPGSQVNAVSRSGGRVIHGSIYDYFTHDGLNARNFFDYTNGPANYALTALRFQRFQNGQPVGQTTVPVRFGVGGNSLGTQDAFLPNPSDGENKLHRNQGGFTIGVPFNKKYFGPMGKDDPTRTFFFGSFEWQESRANQETHFAVPTVEQRGFFNFGASGFNATDQNGNQGTFFPTFLAGDAAFSLYPLPNNPIGPYGRNTFTQVLPANALGRMFSLKFDHNFTMFGPDVTHTFTARYNFTNDERDIPAVGNAIFSSIEPHVGTQNISLFLNSQLSLSVANQLRGSYGRTRLRFNKLGSDLLTSSLLVPDNPYLLNRNRVANFTTPDNLRPFVDYRLAPNLPPAQQGLVFRPVEDALGPVGQVIVAPFDAVGLDPYLFPQARTNNTFQIADTLTYFRGNHTFKVGADIRRTQLNSFLDRNYRTQVIYGGTLDLSGVLDKRFPDAGVPFPNFSQFGPTPGYFRGADLAALGLPTGIFQSLSAGPPDSTIGLRFWQQNYFFNGNWRARPGLTIDYGVRYEFNTVPREVNNRIEDTFDLGNLRGADPSLRVGLSFFTTDGRFGVDPVFNSAPLIAAFAQTQAALRSIIAGRETIYDSDLNNFAPHFSFAWDPSPNSLTQAGKTIIRGGFGVYYDVALGSVVSQSRNVFPTSIPMNLDVNTLNNLQGILDQRFFDQNLNGNGFIRIINPTYLPTVIVNAQGQVLPLTCPGNANLSIMCANSLNQLGIQPGATQALLGLIFNPSAAVGQDLRPSGGGLAFTLPDRNLRSPYSYQYNLQIERELFRNYVLNVAYVGMRGLKLTRFRTPNGGLNSPTFPVDPLQIVPDRPLVPAISLPLPAFPEATGFRTDRRLGAYTIFDSSADASYHSLQTSVTKRFSAGYELTGAYTYSHGIDDVSDVFDVAGAFVLPQNDRNLNAERGNANFDMRHRFAFSSVFEFPGLRKFDLATGAKRAFLGGWNLSSIVMAQTGQPFTVNTSYDINLDGNLTDRLNTTNGLTITDDRRQRIIVTTNNPGSLLPPVINNGTGTVTPLDGAVGRNTFRSSGAFKVDLTVIKYFRIAEGHDIVLRVESFNLFNRSHFGIPVRILEAPSFGTSVNTTINPRQIQIALKYVF